MKSAVAVIGVTVYLILFTFLFISGVALNTIPYMFLLSPFLVVAMILTVLKDNSHNYPELGPNEEWGYRDRSKGQLGIF